jgi:hypothetical protein
MPLNPYAPSASVDDCRDESLPNVPWRDQKPPPPLLAKLCLRWTLVCLIAAAPSFIIAYSAQQHAPVAMLLGILCFIVAYVWLDYHTHYQVWRRHPFVRRMLVFGYGTRVAISLVFPVGSAVDLVSGMMAYSVVGMIFNPNSPEGIEKQAVSFGVTFLLTMVQGAILNIILAAWCLVCSVIVLFFSLCLRTVRHFSSKQVGTVSPTASER